VDDINTFITNLMEWYESLLAQKTAHYRQEFEDLETEFLAAYQDSVNAANAQTAAINAQFQAIQDQFNALLARRR